MSAQNHIGTFNPNQFAPDHEQIVFTPEQLEAQKLDRIRDAAPQLLAALEENVLFVEQFWRDMGCDPKECPAIVETHAIIAAAKGE
jgi:hypothetical protein